MRHIKMKLSEFFEIPDNPIQRNTVAHAQLASRSSGHLATINPTHAKVAIAETERGRRWLLDGHSRRYLWSRGELEAPETLFVDVYPVKNEAEALDLYKTFDSDMSVERPRDKLWGAMKYHGIEPKRPFMFTNTGVISAMKILALPNKWADVTRMGMYNLVEPWVETLKWMDQIEPFYNHYVFPSFVTTAMMFTIKRDGNSALPFWGDYHEGNGTRTKTTESPAYTARQFADQTRAERTVAGKSGSIHSYSGISTLAPKLIWIYDHWARDARVPNNTKFNSKRFEKELPNLAEYWDTQIGDRLYPQLRQQKELEL